MYMINTSAIGCMAHGFNIATANSIDPDRAGKFVLSRLGEYPYIQHSSVFRGLNNSSLGSCTSLKFKVFADEHLSAHKEASTMQEGGRAARTRLIRLIGNHRVTSFVNSSPHDKPSLSAHKTARDCRTPNESLVGLKYNPEVRPPEIQLFNAEPESTVLVKLHSAQSDHVRDEQSSRRRNVRIRTLHSSAVENATN